MRTSSRRVDFEYANKQYSPTRCCFHEHKYSLFLDDEPMEMQLQQLEAWRIQGYPDLRCNEIEKDKPE